MTQENRYAARFARVFEFIDQHLDQSLTLEQLSQVAHFSKYHFNRQFSGYTGISVVRYVQLLRLKRASYRLVFHPEEPITDIALDAGFENPESFSRAFKHTFGQSPSAFRKSPDWMPWNQRYQFPCRTRSQTMQVNIVLVEPVQIAVLEHRGHPDLLNESVRRFVEWRKASGSSPIQSSQTYGIVYDNPATTAPEQFRFDIAGSVTEPVADNPIPIINKLIPAGRCAVVRHQGSHDRIGDSAGFLYRDWLPDSGEELRDFPMYFHFLNLMPATAEHALLTDIYLPLK